MRASRAYNTPSLKLLNLNLKQKISLYLTDNTNFIYF